MQKVKGLGTVVVWGAVALLGSGCVLNGPLNLSDLFKSSGSTGGVSSPGDGSGSGGNQQSTLSGTWSVTRPDASFQMTLTESTTGQVTGLATAGSDKATVSGTRSGTRVSLKLQFPSGAATYEGTLSSDGKQITGHVDGDTTDTFTANRK